MTIDINNDAAHADGSQISNANKTPWQAALLEQRTAWLIAACAIVLIIIAATRPAWFDFPANTTSSQLTHNQPDRTQPDHSKHAHNQPATNTATNTAKSAIKKLAPVAHATKKPAQIKHKATSKIPPLQRVKQPTPASTSHAGKGFYVQLGAFKDKERAQRLKNKLKKKGWNVHIIRRETGFHAIWVGPESTHNKAEKLLKNIQHKLKTTGFIVQNNS